MQQQSGQTPASVVARRQLESSGGHLGTEVVETKEGGGITEKKGNRKTAKIAEARKGVMKS